MTVENLINYLDYYDENLPILIWDRFKDELVDFETIYWAIINGKPCIILDSVSIKE